MNKFISHILICILIFVCPMLFSWGNKEKPAKNEIQSMEKSIDEKKSADQNQNTNIDSGFYNSAATGKTVEITGTVRLVGSEPFNEIVVTEAEKYDWYIENREDRNIISKYEQQTVTVKGTVILKEMILANGKSLGNRRILANISLIK